MRLNLIIAICVLSILVRAQAPQAFNYQGVARNTVGDPIVNTNIALRVSILEGTLPGSQVYREQHNVTTNKLGLFSLEIGKGTNTTGVFNNINWGGGQHHLQLEMDPAGGTAFQVLGTSQLLSVPYALYAEKSGDASSQWLDNASGIHYTGGNVGIGTSTPLNKLYIAGNVATGDGRTFVRLDNRSTSNRSVVAINLTAGDNASETSLGHHSETYDFEGTSFTDFGQLLSSGAGLILTASGESGIIKFATNSSDIANYEKMRLTSNGYLGIGTEDPNARLQVANGDIYVETSVNGVILKSPNGSCYRLTVDNAGVIKTTAVTCPN